MSSGGVDLSGGYSGGGLDDVKEFFGQPLGMAILVIVVLYFIYYWFWVRPAAATSEGWTLTPSAGLRTDGAFGEGMASQPPSWGRINMQENEDAAAVFKRACPSEMGVDDAYSWMADEAKKEGFNSMREGNNPELNLSRQIGEGYGNKPKF